MSGGRQRPHPASPRSRPPAVPARDSKSSLYDAAVAAVQDRTAQVREARRPPPRRRSPVVRILGLLALVGLLLLLLRPSWLAGPAGLPAEPEAVATASMRLVLIRERDLVRAYLQRTGQLPATLGEASSTAQGVEYRRVGAGFVLSATAGDSAIVLRDSDSSVAFLGSSLTRLKTRELP